MTHATNQTSYDDSKLIHNIALNLFRIATAGGLAGVQQAEDGFLDEFEDESGVDTANCTDQSYDGANDLYGGLGATDLCAGGAPISGGDNGANTKDKAFDNNDCVTNWYSSQVDAAANGSAYIGYDFGAGNERAINKVRILQTDSTNAITSVLIQHSDNGVDWTTIETWNGLTRPSGGAWEETTFTNETTHRYWRYLANAQPNGSWGVCEIEMIRVTTGFTILSNAVEAEADDPVKGTVVLFVDLNGETITVNTDLIAYLSMDDGVNYETLSLQDEGLYETDKHIYAGEVSMTAQSDKNMVIKVAVTNSKDIYIEGWFAGWSY